jgi:threonine dehydrogenase-like Zn-dependent dehydrogenase
VKALVYDGAARRAALADVAEPEPAEGEVLLTPAYSALCGSDVHMSAGSPAYGWMPSPIVIGHELAGRIPGSDALHLVNPYLPCGVCKMCLRGNTSTCLGPSSAGRGKEQPPWSLQYGFRRPGGHAERMVVRREALLPVPAGLPARLASLAEGVAVAVHAVKVGVPLLLGARLETAVVLGPGPVGLGATLTLASRGTRTAVLGLLRDAERLARAERLGADAALDAPEALEATVDAWTARAGVDLVIEATGSEAGLRTALAAVRRGGVVVAIGIPGAPFAVSLREIVRGGVVVAGSYGVTAADLVETLDLLARDVARSEALVDRAFPLADAAAALSHAARSSGKVLLEIAP